MMNFKGPKGHKFAESPVLKLRLPAWRSRLIGLLIPRIARIRGADPAFAPGQSGTASDFYPLWTSTALTF